MHLWQVWVIVAIGFFIAEIFTSGFFSATIGLAVLGMAVTAWLGFGLKPQIIAFAGTALVTFFALRPLFLRYLSAKEPAARTNMDALIGSSAIVTELMTSGSRVTVRIGREEWPATGERVDELKVGDKVRVCSITGNHVVIERFEK